MRPGEQVQVNGRAIKPPASGFTLVRKSVLKEVTIVAIGADANTSVAIAANAKEKSMSSENTTVAAERVLTDAREPMTCKAMVKAMAAKGLWTSPGGTTPEATLYSSLLRQIRAKGKGARFKKIARGQFDLAKRPC